MNNMLSINYLRPALISVTALLVFSGAGCQVPETVLRPSVQQDAPSNTMTNSSLSEQEFMQLYANVRSALNESTPDRLLSLLDQQTSAGREQSEIFRANWGDQEAHDTWKRFLPDLVTMRRADYRAKGDWAAYYFEYPGKAESNSIDLNVERAHRVNNEWKLALGNGGSAAFSGSSDPAAREQAIQKQIETSEVLTVEPRAK